MKELIAFDLDGTLAESKSEMDAEMVDLLIELNYNYQVAIISGGALSQFKKQFLRLLDDIPDNVLKLFDEKRWFNKLHILPTSGASYYTWDRLDTLEMVYQEKLAPEELSKIYLSLYQVITNTGFSYPEIYGQQIEYRITQVTFSALGQEAPLKLKKSWDPDTSKRRQMVQALERQLPEFAIRFGGTTSIDITKKGIDKAFGMAMLSEHLGIGYEDILFIGDALKPGGNDYVVKSLGIECIEVQSVNDTKAIIRNLL